MAKTENSTREQQKKRLRQRTYETSVMREIDEAEQAVRTRRRNRILSAAAVIAAIALIAAGVIFIRYRKQYDSYSIVNSVQTALAGETQEAFAGGVIRWSVNGAAYMTSDGSTVWDSGFHMQDPVLTLGGEYGMITDRGGLTAVVFSESGVSGTITSTLPIKNSCLSHHGVAALMLEADNSSLIRFYDRTGRKLDIEIKNVLAEESGYPVDIAISPEGTGLVLSLLFMDSGTMQTRLSFMNFDTGKDSSDRVVGLFEHNGHIFPDVRYLSNSRVCAFGDSGLEFYSVSGDGTPKSISSVEIKEPIESVFSCEDRVGVVCRSEGTGHKLMVYDADGDLKYTRDIGFNYTQISFSGRYLIAANETDCLILNRQGRVNYQGTFAGRTYKTICSGLNTFIQLGDYGIREVRLK